MLLSLTNYRPHKMSYCPIYKAASTTWLHQLLILAGRTEESIKYTKKQLSEQARAIYPVQDSDQVEEVCHFTFFI